MAKANVETTSFDRLHQHDSQSGRDGAFDELSGKAQPPSETSRWLCERRSYRAVLSDRSNQIRDLSRRLALSNCPKGPSRNEVRVCYWCLSDRRPMRLRTVGPAVFQAWPKRSIGPGGNCELSRFGPTVQQFGDSGDRKDPGFQPSMDLLGDDLGRPSALAQAKRLTENPYGKLGKPAIRRIETGFRSASKQTSRPLVRNRNQPSTRMWLRSFLTESWRCLRTSFCAESQTCP
jgi:hypothetical protein